MIGAGDTEGASSIPGACRPCLPRANDMPPRAKVWRSILGVRQPIGADDEIMSCAALLGLEFDDAAFGDGNRGTIKRGAAHRHLVRAGIAIRRGS